MYTIKDLKKTVSTYLKKSEVEKIYSAYQFSAKAHEGQFRASGELYIHHPLEVAGIMADMHMDYQTMIASFLHDVIEDTPTAKNEIHKQFGKSVADLVDGVSKLTQIEFDSHAEAQAYNFRKMIMAMSNDIRVILVKLADRLHNMRTLCALSPPKRRRIARETLEIYAPIAQRLGINSIRLELEELGFAALNPMRYRILTEHVAKARGNRKEIVNKIRNALKRRLRQEKIHARVAGREKHLYGIYQKMRTKNLSFREVYDVYAFRIIVESVDMCYRTIGTVHNLYKPVPGKFKDYIAIPKANGYQSLHTILFGPFGVPIEVQIRTREINDVAEAGIAAHWLYKVDGGGSDKNAAHKRAREWLKSIVDMQTTAGNPQEFLENVKVDLFPESVYIFTPKGRIIELPRGATAVDFAYAIHTDIGSTCVGVRVDRRLAPLGTRVTTGQTAEVITAPGAHPNPAWLNFTVTAKARSNIRHYLKNLKNNEAIAMGKRLLNRELEVLQVNYQDIVPAKITKVLEEYQWQKEDDLLREIGLGNQMVPLLAKQLIDESVTAKQKKLNGEDKLPLTIKGSEGMVINFPKCCLPIPGDPILGFVTAGRGLVIHHQSCPNISEYRNHPDKWINVEWESNMDREFSTNITVEVTNQRGVLATIASSIANQEANIINVTTMDNDDRYTTLKFVIEVRNRVHLAQIMKQLRKTKHVSHIARR